MNQFDNNALLRKRMAEQAMVENEAAEAQQTEKPQKNRLHELQAEYD